MLFSKPRSGGRIGRRLGAFLLSIAATVTLLAPAGAARAEDPPPSDYGIATRPAGADGMPDDRTRLEYSADPGQSVSDQVLIGNSGKSAQDFTVYATDAFNAENGDFSLLATADAPTSIGAWVRFENGENRVQFTLQPEEVRLVKFTVAFPADATPGDHVGGLVASVLQKSEGVSIDRRVATAMYARVSGELQPRLNLASFDATYQGDWWNPFGGTVKVLYTVDNPGNVALSANVSMKAVTWFGIPVTGAGGTSIPVLLPGNSATYEYDLTGIGQWGYLNPSAELMPFVETTDPTRQALAATVTRDTIVLATPWMLLILIAIGVGVYLLIRWRRRRDEVRAQEWIEYTEKKAAAAAAEAAAAPRDTASHSSTPQDSAPR